MGVRIINGTDEAALYCSTTMWAFGPVFDDYDSAESFLEWWKAKDARICGCLPMPSSSTSITIGATARLRRTAK